MTAKTDRGWCLLTPSGRFIGGTFSTDKDDCWARSFGYLYTRKSWMKPFYKKWDESIAAAESRGWEIVEAQITHA